MIIYDSYDNDGDDDGDDDDDDEDDGDIILTSFSS